MRRKLRSLSQSMKFTKKSILIITPSTRAPDELKDEVVLEDVPLPDLNELQEVLGHLTEVSGVRINLTPLGKEKLVKACAINNLTGAMFLLRQSCGTERLDDTDIDLVTDEKKQIIRESQALEFFPFTESMDNVGGLKGPQGLAAPARQRFFRPGQGLWPTYAQRDCLAWYSRNREKPDSKDDRRLWRMPLLRLDVGALFGSLVGESRSARGGRCTWPKPSRRVYYGSMKWKRPWRMAD